jgi:acyl-coenzyme A thioesterase PaaI-like protein
MKASRLRRFMAIWPPFLFTGIRVVRLDDDFGHARVELRERWFNRNYVGTHFGGSLFAMTDPFWMIMLMRRLGPGYRVWDQAGEIRFEKPGRGTVIAEFALDPAVVESIRAAAADGAKVLHWFETEVRDRDGDVVARVRKQVYVRRTPGRRPVDDPPPPPGATDA